MQTRGYRGLFPLFARAPLGVHLRRPSFLLALLFFLALPCSLLVLLFDLPGTEATAVVEGDSEVRYVLVNLN